MTYLACSSSRDTDHVTNISIVIGQQLPPYLLTATPKWRGLLLQRRTVFRLISRKINAVLFICSVVIFINSPSEEAVATKMAHMAYQNGCEPERFETENSNGDITTPSDDIDEHVTYGDIGDMDFSGMETPADTAFARTKREEEVVLRCIQQARAIGSPTVDLSGKHLMAIPDELMQMEGLEVLSLSLSPLLLLVLLPSKLCTHNLWIYRYTQ